MNREILFRGKRIDNGEWIYGYYFEATYCDGEGRCSYIKIDGSSGIKVVPETLGQYTGVKDKNGVEIFEGDILHERMGRSLVDKRIVKYYKGSFIAESTATFGSHNYDAYHEKFRTIKFFADTEANIVVIGNIHDKQEKP